MRRIASQQASVAWLGSVALVAFLGLIAVEGWSGYERARLELEAGVRAHARLTTEHLERTLQTIEVVFDSVTASLGARSWEEIEGSRGFQRELSRIADNLPQMRSIWLVDQNGYMRAYSGQWPVPRLDAFEREYYRVHALDDVEVLHPGNPMPGRFTGDEFIPVSRPIRIGSHSFRGVAVAAVEPKYYLPILTARGVCEPCTTAFYRPDGAVLFSTDGRGTLAPDLVDGISQIIASDAYAIVVAAWVPQSAVFDLWWDRESGLILASLAAAVLLTWLLRRAVRANRAVLQERDRLQQLASDLAAKNDELAEARAAAERARLLERRLRDEAATANRAKSQFLALMSHELRTPLNAILGFSDIIRGRGQHLGHEKTTDYANDIYSSGEHLLGLINGILDLSKIEAGRFELEEERVPVREVASEAARMLRARFPGKRIELSLDLADVEILADSRSIKQILLNLLSNAWKHTEDGGHVAVGLAATTDRLDLTVSDDGCGMSAEDLERALEPFGQASQPLSRSGEGTGLGLNISKALTELHGGLLLVDSEAGRGTTVTVRLPGHRLLPPAPLAASV